MCKEFLEKGTCKNGKDCKKAHFANQLEMFSIQKKIANLKEVEKSQIKQLNANATIEAWQPPRKYIDVDSKQK